MTQSLPQTIGISKIHLDAHAYPCGDARQFANTAAGFAALLKWIGQWPVERIAYTRMLRVARIIADLSGTAEVSRIHIAEAVSYPRQPPRA